MGRMLGAGTMTRARDRMVGATRMHEECRLRACHARRMLGLGGLRWGRSPCPVLRPRFAAPHGVRCVGEGGVGRSTGRGMGGSLALYLVGRSSLLSAEGGTQ